nr:MAG TPA: hypothetical protein [Caudoviricetes sp.]
MKSHKKYYTDHLHLMFLYYYLILVILFYLTISKK